ncbi:uncharacterized protein LOC122093829 [Macadamia integrifolia]|uniref:uncharacterized protein LOC122093829 n=1 Tax=Macadamia integrifolia TaxID=60698 RepID=UPI001C528EB4|nr:uncharacterized protein LOC122093829 [Macadamia integrifolia]XP_042520279.1 uncharacterized protein LOC122093829 [Macadamia integrifolia]XP_042520280.1 uncharacterized protein LOC122093829 [Macadamia integrifolia]XP_042520281.1 uncharacterized protein LOC122093829 [Macadamia integrifolia]XP_042520282.1 uncharacterized protein LOC122093829 [Macadamia integrifolia]
MSGSSITAVKWLELETTVFIEAMKEAVKNGHKSGNSFDKTGWEDITKQFQKSLNHTVGREQLCNKMNKLRHEYQQFKRLLDTTGFRWNSMTKSVTVDDESVWDRAIQANPGWLKYKKYGLSNWPDLSMIYGDAYARGNLGVDSAQDLDHFEADNCVDIEQVFESPTTPVHLGMTDPFHEDTPTPTQTTTKRSLDRTPTGRRKKSANKEDNHVKDLYRKYLSIKIEKASSTSVTSPVCGGEGASRPRDFSVSACEAVLSSIPDMSKDIYLKATSRMCVDPSWRELFICAKPVKRTWLLDALE